MIQKVNRGGVTVLTIRQIKILESLINNNNEYYTSNQLAQQFNVSIRTIKSDLKEIKNFRLENCMSLYIKHICRMLWPFCVLLLFCEPFLDAITRLLT